MAVLVSFPRNLIGIIQSDFTLWPPNAFPSVWEPLHFSGVRHFQSETLCRCLKENVPVQPTFVHWHLALQCLSIPFLFLWFSSLSWFILLAFYAPIIRVVQHHTLLSPLSTLATRHPFDFLRVASWVTVLFVLVFHFSPIADWVLYNLPGLSLVSFLTVSS